MRGHILKQWTLIIVIFILFISPVFAESSEETSDDDTSYDELYNELAIKDSYSDKLFVTFNYGPTAAWLTRIIKQTGRSNFVLKDFLPGLYFNTELHNLWFFNPEVRVAVYYPLIATFNDVIQKQNTPLHIAMDFIAGARFKTEWNFLTFSGGPGLHVFFMTSDRWNYLNLGLAAAVGIEVAMSPGWTLLIDGFASIDNGNLGTNRDMEQFDVAYQYQTAVGVRYSKKKRNDTALFMPKEKPITKYDR